VTIAYFPISTVAVPERPSGAVYPQYLPRSNMSKILSYVKFNAIINKKIRIKYYKKIKKGID
jgi:hypothetical protein